MYSDSTRGVPVMPNIKSDFELLHCKVILASEEELINDLDTAHELIKTKYNIFTTIELLC